MLFYVTSIDLALLSKRNRPVNVSDYFTKNQNIYSSGFHAKAGGTVDSLLQLEGLPRPERHLAALDGEREPFHRHPKDVTFEVNMASMVKYVIKNH